MQWEVATVIYHHLPKLQEKINISVKVYLNGEFQNMPTGLSKRLAYILEKRKGCQLNYHEQGNTNQ